MVIDFHSHALPGLDDGSRNAEMSVGMLRAARQQGVELQVLTPHFYRWKEDISSFAERRRESCGVLKKELPRDIPALLVGSETAFFPHMSREDLSELCIEGTRVLLVEMPFESWEGHVTDEIARLSLDCGYHVVLAHIERFLRYKGNAEELLRLQQLPIHIQSNAEVFLSFMSRSLGLKLIKSGTVTILGSDAHNLDDRRPNLGPARETIAKRLGLDVLARIDSEATALLGRVAEMVAPPRKETVK